MKNINNLFSQGQPNLLELLQFQVQNAPDKIAYTVIEDGETDERSLTWLELQNWSKVIGGELLSSFLPGDRVLLFYPTSLEFIATFFGCAMAGIIAVPMPVIGKKRIDFDRFSELIRNVNPAGFAVHEKYDRLIREKISGIPALSALPWFQTPSQGQSPIKAFSACHPSLNDIVFLQYTSGSTGMPKGVMVSHNNIVHNVSAICESFHVDSKSTILGWLPFYHDMGLIGYILSPVYSGATCVMLPPMMFLQKPLRWLQAVSKYQAGFAGGPNFAYDLCVDKISDEEAAQLDLRNWTTAFSGAEPVLAATMRRFAEKFAISGFSGNSFSPCYGMAESTLLISGGSYPSPPKVVRLDAELLEQNKIELTGNADEKRSKELVSCGTIHSSFDFTWKNPATGEVSKPNEIGELWLSGPSIAQGYWNCNASDQDNFQLLPSDNGEKIWLRTGDLGFHLERELYITGRKKDLIIIRGQNFYPNDIEMLVESCNQAFVQNGSAAFSIEDEYGEQAVVTVEIKRSMLKTFDDKLAGQKIFTEVSEYFGINIKKIIFVEPATLPKTTSGKIRRKECRQLYLNGALEQISEWEPGIRINSSFQKNSHLPGTALPDAYNWLCSKIATLIGTHPSSILPHAPFSNLGLDSLNIVRLTGEIEETFQQKIPPSAIYDYPTVASLAAYLKNQSSTIQSRPENVPYPEVEPIAIIGMACRFPGANSLSAYWELISSGKSAVKQVPDSRWSKTDLEIFSEYKATPVSYAGLIDQLDQFDAAFFGISKREATKMDPQQRLLLEVAWEALENSAINPQKCRGKDIGVFIGAGNIDYQQFMFSHIEMLDAWTGTGNTSSILANRISYFLDLQGPSMTIDTACSSSLVAVHLASSSLRAGESELALAGAVNLLITPGLSSILTKAGMLSPVGKCKTFDASADGYVRGEGCGMVVLKLLKNAIRDNDQIWAVINGTAVNQDGQSNGLTAPNGIAQEKVILKALKQAGIGPDNITYIETHGTGTPLGDPIEVNALGRIFKSTESRQDKCFIGSIKTNIGHLEAAAGIAGLIKTVLALQHKTIPQTLNFSTLNPYISLENTALEISESTREWSPRNGIRAAGVSGFGFGGTNAHVVLSEYTTDHTEEHLEEPSNQLFIVSANTPASLETLCQSYHQYLKTNKNARLSDICRIAAMGRAHFPNRLAILATDTSALKSSIEAYLEEVNYPGVWNGNANEPAKIAFLYSGQGAQYAGMARTLYSKESVFREAFDRCIEVAERHLEVSLADLLLTSDYKPELIHETQYTQPALFALEYAITELWKSWGIHPNAVMGHSVGEFAASCAAGIMLPEQGMELICRRGQLIQNRSSEGSMLIVFTNSSRIKEIIAEQHLAIDIAAYNGPSLTVVSGMSLDIDMLGLVLEKWGIKSRKLQVSRAFHSRLLDVVQPEFEMAAAEYTFFTPKIPFVSNLTGTVMNDAPNADYWGKHMRDPVLFQQGIQALGNLGMEIFLEIGPGTDLISMAKNILPQPDIKWINTIRKKEEGLHSLYQSLATLYTNGLNIDWGTFIGPKKIPAVLLPTYPFQRERHWVEVPLFRSESYVQNSESPIGSSATSSEPTNFYQISWKKIAPRFSKNTVQSTELNAWMIFADQGGLGEKIARQLTNKGAITVLVYRNSLPQNTEPKSLLLKSDSPQGYSKLFEQAPVSAFSNILHLWDLDNTDGLDPNNWEEVVNLGCISIVYLLQCLHHNTGQKLPHFTLVTRGSQVIGVDNEQIRPLSAPVWALGNTVLLEFPMLKFKCVDLPFHLGETDINILIDDLLINDNETQIALRNGSSWVPRLKRHPISEKTSEPSPDPLFISEGWYLITGGLGDLGLKTAEWMVYHGAKHIILTGRSGPKNGFVNDILKRMHDVGVEVIIKQANIANQQEVEQLFLELNDADLPLKGIFHAAGALDDGILLEQNIEKFHKVIESKILGTWNLHTFSESAPLDWFVCYSSIAAILGSPGQGNYCAANAYMDALVQYRCRQNQPGLSINWGPWRSQGMAQNWERSAIGWSKRIGMNMIEPEAGILALERLLKYRQNGAAAVLTIDTETLQSATGVMNGGQLYSELVGKKTSRSKSVKHRWATLQHIQHLENEPPETQQLSIKNYLVQLFAEVSGSPADTIEIDTPLNSSGMDSLTAIQVKNLIYDDLCLEIDVLRFMEGACISDLSDEIFQRYASSQQPPQPLAQHSGNEAGDTLIGMDSVTAAHLLQNVGSQTEEEIDALLKKLLSEKSKNEKHT